MDDRQPRRFLLGGVRDVLAPAHDHNVAAGGFLYMEPQVLAPGGVQGELVVLGVVAAYQNLKAIAGGIAQKVRRLLLFVPLLVVLQVALIFQLHADLVQGGFAGGAFHLVMFSVFYPVPILPYSYR